ncbi:hypothetical protein [Anaeromicrobium sediminis]|uniref:Uncharacterized protein n=1 Tax=Anaeromicrobium sediminis TaxID=1478221 RepID=A0A267MBZ6_9FIRM|nr:hypothetical protein [Anaeromicrobium sediminis]PAB57114.1 hypothetical protein CCE28_19480 [Anaeromicrobium sediminis]
MNLANFQNKLDLIQNYTSKLKRENVPITTQKILIKTYADDLEINLTNKMIFEILSYDYIHHLINRIH